MNPIERKLRSRHCWGEFLAHMKVHDMPDTPDGAWFAILEQAAERFFTEVGLSHLDGNDGAHAYLNAEAQ